jgi:hypothetical protein
VQNLSLKIGSDTIEPVTDVRDCGVHLDWELSMKKHVCKVTAACFHTSCVVYARFVAA